MTRFCAILATETTEEINPHTLSYMGARSVYQHAVCSLGLLPTQRATETETLYRVGSLVAVGTVTLFNRDLLEDRLSDGALCPAHQNDGELFLHYFLEKGIDGFADINGMFSLAIWDGDRLLLVRDAVGARTLFYTQAAGYWAASSSLHALRRWPRLTRHLNLAAVRSFLTFAYLPGSETLLDGVHELLPGCCLEINIHPQCRQQQAKLHTYWEPHEQSWHESDPPEFYAQELRQRLETAILQRLPAGQSAGLFLSGGLDSSLVTALAARMHDRPVHTYALSFDPKLPNELAYSSMVAAHCQTEHHVLTFNDDQMASGLVAAVAQLDCPVGDPLTAPNLLLAQAAAADGHQVILNGEGGDPCFGGPKNLPLLAFECHRATAAPEERARAYLHSYGKLYADLPHLFTPAALANLHDAPPLERLVQPFLEASHIRHYLNRLMLTNVRTKGAHHILPKVESISAICGLEARSPLFDPAIVAYAFAIPPHLKLRGTTEKWILKEAVRDLLPATIINRPKSGMLVPVRYWLHAPLRQMAEHLLLGKRARQRGIFRPEIIQKWMAGKGMIWPREGQAIWLLLTLEIWLRAYLDGDDSAEVIQECQGNRYWRSLRGLAKDPWRQSK